MVSDWPRGFHSVPCWRSPRFTAGAVSSLSIETIRLPLFSSPPFVFNREQFVYIVAFFLSLSVSNISLYMCAASQSLVLECYGRAFPPSL